MKTTATVTATYNTRTTLWKIRDNGQVIVEGKGLASWSRALSTIRSLTDKPIRAKTTH